MFKTFTKIYQKLISFGGYLKSPLLLLIRLFWGGGFIAAGWMKLQDPSLFSNFLTELGVPFPLFFAYLVPTIELVGGICLFLGFAARLAAIPLILVMFVAYSTAHVESLKVIWSSPQNFVMETAFNFMLTCFLVLAFGPGRFSVDYLLEEYFFHHAQDFPRHQH